MASIYRIKVSSLVRSLEPKTKQLSTRADAMKPEGLCDSDTSRAAARLCTTHITHDRNRIRTHPVPSYYRQQTKSFAEGSPNWRPRSGRSRPKAREEIPHVSGSLALP